MLHGVINVLSQVYLLSYSRKKKTNRGGWGYTFLKTPPGIFYLFTWLLKFLDKKLNPWIFHKIALNPWEIPHYFFLVTLGNSTLFLIDPWKSHMLFLWYPGKFHILTPPPPLFHPPCLGFFWNSPFKSRVRFLVSNLHKDAFTEI